MRFEVDGATVNAATGGSPPGGELPLVILVHGAGMDRTVWSLVTRRIVAAGHDVLAVDLPGHGGSSGPQPTTIGGLADWLAAVIGTRPQRTAHLIGHSMGALVSLQAAANHPGLVSSLTLLAVSSQMQVHPQLMAAAHDRRHLAHELMVDWMHTPASKVGRGATPGVVTTAAAMRSMDRAPGGALTVDLKACASYGGAVGAATEVRCPSLVIVGMRDRMTPPGAAMGVIGALEDVTTLRLPANGHGMLTEAPDEVADAITTFLTGTAR